MNVLLIHLRGCSAGWLGPYGNEWVGTPHLDRLAAEGIVFDRHFAEHASPDPGASRLVEGIAGHGARTILVCGNRDEESATNRGWDEIIDTRPASLDQSPLDAIQAVFPRLITCLLTEQQTLVVVDVDQLLPPWTVPHEVFQAYIEDPDEAVLPGEAAETISPCTDPTTEPIDPGDHAAWEWLQASFAAVVTGLDAELGRLFDMLRSNGLDQSIAWVVTSDIGYPLGEHGTIGWQRSRLHEELVHLPLFVRLPGAAQAGRRVSGFTQPTDLKSTLHEWLDGTPPLGTLMPSMWGRGETPRRAVLTRREQNGTIETAIRTDDWAFLYPIQWPIEESPPVPLLFAKPDDRWEVNDLRSRNIEIVEELERTLTSTGDERPYDLDAASAADSESRHTE